MTNSKSPDVLIMGDSHAMSLFSAIHYDLISIPAVVIGGHSCYLYPDIDFKLKTPMGSGHNCKEIALDVLMLIKEVPSIKTVVIHNYELHDSNFNYAKDGMDFDEKRAFIIGNQSMIDQLIGMGVNVIYLIDTPHLPLTPEQCERKEMYESLPNFCNVERSGLNFARANYHDAVYSLKINKGSLIINAEDFLCDSESCYDKDDEGYFYFDRDHLNVHGSEKVLKNILNYLGH